MTEANLHRCINLNKIQAGDLEKIAHLLGVRVGYFFDEVEISETTCDTITATGPGAPVIPAPSADTIESLRAERDTLLSERDTLRQSLLEAQSRLLSILCP